MFGQARSDISPGNDVLDFLIGSISRAENYKTREKIECYCVCRHRAKMQNRTLHQSHFTTNHKHNNVDEVANNKGAEKGGYFSNIGF